MRDINVFLSSTFVKGVLRGVDMARGLFFLVTPVPPAALRQVNCLLLGEVTLPKMLLTIQVRVRFSKTSILLISDSF